MSKEWKAPDKVTQKMTRDGAVAENLTTGETSSISERPQEENYSAPAGAAAEKVVQHIGAEIERHAAKGAEKKPLTRRSLNPFFPLAVFRSGTGNAGPAKGNQKIRYGG